MKTCSMMFMCCAVFLSWSIVPIDKRRAVPPIDEPAEERQTSLYHSHIEETIARNMQKILLAKKHVSTKLFLFLIRPMQEELDVLCLICKLTRIACTQQT